MYSCRASSMTLAARIRFCVSFVLSCRRNGSSGSAMVSMVAPSYRGFPATPSFLPKTDFHGAVRQALTKLGVAWEPTEAEIAYNEGRSTQVPVNPVVRVKGRFSRRLFDGNRELALIKMTGPSRI